MTLLGFFGKFIAPETNCILYENRWSPLRDLDFICILAQAPGVTLGTITTAFNDAAQKKPYM